jgi:predicted transcriptional regulator
MKKIKAVMLPIHPRWAEMILKGEKRYEYRRRIWKDPDVDRVIIYACAPISKVVGEFSITCPPAICANPKTLWQITGEVGGVTKEEFDEYFAGRKEGHAICICKPLRFPERLDIELFGLTQVPQSFAYVNQFPETLL